MGRGTARFGGDFEGRVVGELVEGEGAGLARGDWVGGPPQGRGCRFISSEAIGL